MQLSECKVWNHDSQSVLKFGKFYSKYNKLIYFLDMLIVVFLVYYMERNSVTFGTYVKVMLTVSIISVFALNLPLKEDLWGTYKFVRKYKNKEVLSMKIHVDDSELYTCLYNCHHSRLKKDESSEYYFGVANSICKKNTKFSSQFMKQLCRFSCDENNENFTVYYLKDKNKMYYLNSVFIESL